MMDENTVKQLKAAVEDLFHTEHGKELVKLLESECELTPDSYNNEMTMAIAVGKSHVLESLRNLDKLTIEQILSYYNGDKR